MLLFAKSRVSLVVSALCMVVCHAASAQLNLSITALDDMPAGGDTPPGVRVQVNAKDLGGTSLFTTTLFWDGNDNTYTTQVLSVPAETRILRFTHLLDCCGSNGPGDCGAGCQVTCDAAGNPDCDRNAFIDSFTLAGSFREGEDFDRTGACGISTVQGRVVAACGLDGTWVEYDVGPFVSITALDDMPAGGDTPPGVRIEVDARDAFGVSLSTATLFWDGDDNNYSTKALAVPAETQILRLTHLLDCCGSNGPGDCGAGCQVTCDAAGNPDCDRNAFIDSFTLAGSFREGEDFDRTASCGISTVQGRVVAACGLDGAWVEYDVGPSVQIPTVSEWGLTVMVILVLSAGTTVFMRRWPKQV